ASCALGAISIMLTRANLAEGASITVIMLLIGVGFFMYFERLYANQIKNASAGSTTAKQWLPARPSLGESNDVP
ncbi:MAG: hypothetical protein JWO59_3489, partial [Chloroflexi bacterium]|nr:hypothetical protein [Chloroflexota bacterium]